MLYSKYGSGLFDYAGMWELPDPIRWIPCYSFVIVDPRGTWYSEGAALETHY
jgi:hypothetical protein